MQNTLINYLDKIPESLDPLTVRDFSAYQILKNICETLTIQEENNEIKLNLLESSTISADGLSYRFAIKKGIFFHCGAELTSVDIVALFLKVINFASSVSQIKAFVATSESGRYLVEAISRYRFKIDLQKRCPDLLYRLSLLEFAATHDKCGAHCGSWILRSAANDKICLDFNSGNFHKYKSHYSEIKILTLPPDDSFNHAITDFSYLFCYPGYKLKSPSFHNTQDSLCLPLSSTISLALRLPENSLEKTSLSQVLSQLFAQCFLPDSPYKREYKNNLLNENHVLFAKETQKPHSSGKLSSQVDLRITGDLPLLSEKIFDSIITKALDLGINIERKLSHPSANNHEYAHIFSIFAPYPNDYLMVLSQLVTSGCIAKRDIHKVAMDQLPLRHAQKIYETVLHDAQIIPIFISPVIARSNRQIDIPATADFIPYHFVNPSSEIRAQQKKDEQAMYALATALPMLAHDIKKPFSMMQALLELLESSSNLNQILPRIKEYVPQLKRHIRNADLLLQDILEIGSSSTPPFENVSLEDLISAVIKDIRSFGNCSKRVFDTDFTHKHMVFADVHKLNLVVNNILSNAVQATQSSSGKIWIKTREEISDSNKTEWSSIITCTIGNNGPTIPQMELSRIFDSFYTMGKKGGTGLGLAIVKKIIENHGGEVWCTSDEHAGTEFHFTLPTSDTLEPERKQTTRIDHDPDSFNRKWFSSRSSDTVIFCDDDETVSTLNVLIIDDDVFYSQLLESQLNKISSAKINIEILNSASEFLQVIQNKLFNLAIIDVYIDNDDPIGLNLCRELKKRQPHCHVCLHSSGQASLLASKGVEAGADQFIPKPLSLAQLQKIIENILPKTRSKIILIDDDPLHLEHWHFAYPEGVISYLSPQLFLKDLAKVSESAKDILAIVIDLRFNNDSMNGIDLAKHLQGLGLPTPCFLSSEIKIDDMPQCIVAQISKNPKKALEDIRRKLSIIE